MGMYVQAFVMPPTLDRVMHHATSYRTYFWHTYGEAEGVEKIPLPSILLEDGTSQSGEHYIGMDNDHARRMGPARYLELAQQFRDKMDAEEPDGPPQYVDDLTEWLQTVWHLGSPWAGCVIVLVPEE